MRFPRLLVTAMLVALSGCAAAPGDNGAAAASTVAADGSASPTPAAACELAARMMAVPGGQPDMALAADVAAAAQKSGTDSMKYLGHLLSRQISITTAAIQDSNGASQTHAVTEAVGAIDKFCRDPDGGVIVGGEPTVAQ